MRDLIKRILREEYYQSDVEVDIMNYSGKDPEIQKMKEKLYYGNSISDSEIKKSEDFFKKEKEKEREVRGSSEKTMLEKIKNYNGSNKFMLSLKKQLGEGKSLSTAQIVEAKKFFIKEEHGNYIVSKGIEAYNKLIGTDKNLFFQESPIVVGKPSDDWKDGNTRDLEKFRDYMSGRVYNKVKISGITDTLLNFIDKEINSVGEKIGFIDKGNWSIYNKSDSNYSNWIVLIDEYDKKGLLGSGNYKSKVDEFFKERPINDVLQTERQRNYIEFLKLKLDEKKLPTKISFADYEMMNEIFFTKKENIKNRIEDSTGVGDDAEIKFFELLKKHKVPDENISNFSNPGNIVDQKFGVDCMVMLKSSKNGLPFRWYPIQIRNNFESAKKVNVFQLGGISVFPYKNSFKYFLSKNEDVPRDFFEDFSFGVPKIPFTFDYFASQQGSE
jgi:hypothetical protein